MSSRLSKKGPVAGTEWVGGLGGDKVPSRSLRITYVGIWKEEA